MAGRRNSATAEYFLRSYESVARSARGALRDYLGDPDPRHVHDLRSSLRRLRALVRVLNKASKKKDRDLQDYEDRCRKLLRLTSPIRDTDVLLQKLATESPDPAVSALAGKIARRRKKDVKASMKAAWKLFESPSPSPDRKRLRGLDSRLKGMLGSLEGKIVEELPVVVSSESKIDELHSLRKHCKTLRYTLQLLPPTGNRTEMVALLSGWQDSLGAIRDSDVMIAHLVRTGASVASSEALRGEKSKRHSEYVRFVRACKRRFGTGRPRLRALR